jgi:formamidopyrimidine-DNA glycosylase
VPELPEVETVVRGLRANLPGRTIVGVRLGKTDFIDDPSALAELLPGLRIAGVERFGKFIHLKMDPRAVPANPASRLHLILHLGMSGRVALRRAGEPVAPHTHAFFELDDGRELRYTDPRRFGRILLLPESRIASFQLGLGAEPLEISAVEFRRRLGRRRARIKALLLDQRVLCGLGNIYADESLWLARIHPARLAERLTPQHLTRLHEAIRQILRSAIRLRGSSISDFLDAEGNPGEYQRQHRVYHRQGQPCFRCGCTIRRMIVAGRSSHFCPRCQPPPRRALADEGKAGVNGRGQRSNRPLSETPRANRGVARARTPARNPSRRPFSPARRADQRDLGGLR